VVGFEARFPGFFWLAAQGGVALQTSPALSAAAVSAQLAALRMSADEISPQRLRKP
jgi:D-arginine dehydrogenase